MNKRNIKIYNIIGNYFIGSKRAIKIYCYATDEPSYIKGPFTTFTRYWVVIEFEGKLLKHCYENPYNANQCFLYYRDDCGIALIECEKEGESQ